jgi:hypothetical protein
MAGEKETPTIRVFYSIRIFSGTSITTNEPSHH